MKIVDVKALDIDAIRVVRFARFCDDRGYFAEQYRRSDFQNHPEMAFMKGIEFYQCNESFSRAGTIRGLHFQWNPYMGKLVRTIAGRMVDLVLDIRKGSPSYGQAIGYDMPANRDGDADEWIWVPPGFAHGNLFTEDTVIEYMCSGEYSQGCEAGVSPMASDIDWSLCEPALKKLFDDTATQAIITDKDRDALSLTAWGEDERSENFIYGKLGDD
jgi:dTDP-4-dehydrorhamnose 3,5-epimerase